MAIETTDVQPLHCESAIRDGNRRVSDDRFIFGKVEKTMTKKKVPMQNGSSLCSMVFYKLFILILIYITILHFY